MSFTLSEYRYMLRQDIISYAASRLTSMSSLTNHSTEILAGSLLDLSIMNLDVPLSDNSATFLSEYINSRHIEGIPLVSYDDNVTELLITYKSCKFIYAVIEYRYGYSHIVVFRTRDIDSVLKWLYDTPKVNTKRMNTIVSEACQNLKETLSTDIL